MNVNDYLRLPYHIEVVHSASPEDSDEGWVAEVRELKGCIAQGRTPDELLANVRTAMEIWIEHMLERAKPIPRPYDEPEHSGRFLARVPPALHSALAEEAQRQDVSLNQLVTALLAGGIGWRGTIAPGEGQFARS